MAIHLTRTRSGCRRETRPGTQGAGLVDGRIARRVETPQLRLIPAAFSHLEATHLNRIFTLVKIVLTDVLTLLTETVNRDYVAVPPRRAIGRIR